MPPAGLHPRSRLTTSLFTTTLAVSFLVVAIPHALPCPVPPRAFADARADLDGMFDPDEQSQQGTRRRCRKRRSKSLGQDDMARAEKRGAEGGADGEHKPSEAAGPLWVRGERWRKMRTRECPVPKPGGLVGQVLGFKAKEESDGAGSECVPVVKVQPFRERRVGTREENRDSDMR
ncbi:hypothetical protein BDY21DRAFT_339332 [Lineolata rhizophorae]|uniref:Alpha-1,3-mannosyltransferase n=1 Tax=Lineolata rhizophorae TaxID=578093 RepID=A0A6A6P4X5_9PEZI|nr:hypothetical protein BDY21DRAFT_339332 [Lineolata rhizophorae]